MFVDVQLNPRARRWVADALARTHAEQREFGFYLAEREGHLVPVGPFVEGKATSCPLGEPPADAVTFFHTHPAQCLPTPSEADVQFTTHHGFAFLLIGHGEDVRTFWADGAEVAPVAVVA